MPIFIALMVPDERLVSIGKCFEKYGYHIVNTDMLHLTLLFIGDYKGAYLHRISGILSDVEVEVPGILEPLSITLLPSSKATNVVVLVNDRSGRLARARKTIEKKISKYVKINDRYEFKSHVTIAKRSKPLGTSKYTEVSALINKLNRVLPRFLVVEKICLIETVKGGRYRCVLELKARWI